MKVIWTNFASEMLFEVFLYYKEQANVRIAKRIRNNLFQSTKALLTNSKLGQIELTLETIKEGHRYLIVGNYKVVYKEITEGILVTDVFHTSQDPNKLNRNSG